MLITISLLILACVIAGKGFLKLFTTLCLVSLSVFHTSCNDSVMDLESPSVEIKTRAAEQRVRHLIQQARLGEAEACYSLAMCYRNGDGVEKSWLNMICMYAIYCQKTGNDIDGIVDLFEEGHPFRLLTEIVDSPSFNEEAEAKLEELKHLAPAEAKAVEAAYKAFSMKEVAGTISTLQEAEEEGSEVAAVFLAVYYDKAEDKTGQEECLVRIAEKYPFFNLLLGEVYAVRYRDNNDFSYIRKAIECYYKADGYGMLIPKYANILLGMYDYWGQKGMLEYDEQEIERLKVLAKRTY